MTIVQEYSGVISKLKSVLLEPVQYTLPIGDKEVLLNDYLGKKITLTFLNAIHCIYCHKKIKKSFGQGYCFPCVQTLARCDLCILKPETCHFHLGTCREPDWGLANCFIPHIVYLANTSGLKVGITRETQVPTRWIDQGATEALPILKVKSRYQAGLIEVAFKNWVNDKTDWRKMLKGLPEPIALIEKKEELLLHLDNQEAMKKATELDFTEMVQTQKTTQIHYPVLNYPEKITGLNIEKNGEASGFLQGIKGQYLILDTGVINVRNLTGYSISFFG